MTFSTFRLARGISHSMSPENNWFTAEEPAPRWLSSLAAISSVWLQKKTSNNSYVNCVVGDDDDDDDDVDDGDDDDDDVDDDGGGDDDKGVCYIYIEHSTSQRLSYAQNVTQMSIFYFAAFSNVSQLRNPTHISASAL